MSGPPPRILGEKECIIIQFLNGLIICVEWINSMPEYHQFVRRAVFRARFPHLNL
jgi:hypothetical protein